MRQLETIEQEALSQIQSSEKLDALESLRVMFLGKSGVITAQMKQVGELPVEERKLFGAKINALKDAVSAAIDSRKSVLETAALSEQLKTETVDVTLPARSFADGKIHPVSQVVEEITAIFADLGFAVAEGPDIEDDFHNFTALNIPESHPARAMHDTFYLENGKVLRTHTSPVQIHVMKSGKPPFRAIAPGATYRSDSDQTHTPMFHQIEGFAIDRNIHMGHLKWVIEEFLKAFFELPSVPVRFRPSFFPFTEPSAEVDIGCKRSKDELKIGAGDDWLEVMGCGMVHPNVLRNCNIDPSEWQGFAFGMGVERLAMLKYGIPDLRTFFESDIRWLKHYGFASLAVPNLIGGL
jgi:phenylalanyl-tRNA synthetase alpha chain